jgi:ATP-dependent Zn protease
MNSWLFLVLEALAATLLGWMIVRLWRPVARRRPSVAAGEDGRTAVHEAGHTVVSWTCSVVYEISEVSIDPRDDDEEREAFTLYKVFKVQDETPRGQWCRTVMNLGGLAAEMMVYGRIRTGGSWKDLAIARRRASWLVEVGETTPPWKLMAEGVGVPKFAEMFEEPISEEEVRVLNICWRMARAVLSAHREGHGTLAEALVKNRKVDGGGVALALGRRLYDNPVIRIMRRLVLDEWFYIPRLGTAELATEMDEKP